MSGPGGPATGNASMTPPSQGGAAQNMARIKSNIQKMIDQSAPESDIDAYLSHEGVTPEQLKNSPVAAPYQKDTTTVAPYNPTFMQRIGDLQTENQTGKAAPSLPSDAGLGNTVLDYIQSLVRSGQVAAHGVTGGLSDEAGGLGQGAADAISGKSFGQGFQQGSAAENANIDRFKGNNPITGGLLETGGMAVSPLYRIGQGWQQAGGNAASRAFRSGALGMGYGGEAGAAYNRGGISDRLDDAMWGGLLGGTVSAAASPLLEGGTRGGQGFYNTFQAQRQAANDPAEQARRLLALAIQRDNLTPLPSQGEALVSAGGPNVQALGRQATVAPGNARAQASDYFATSAADRPDVIANSAAQNISNSRLLPTLEALDTQQRAAAAPAYEAFYNTSPDAFDTPFFQNLLQSDTGRTLIRNAHSLAEVQRAAGRTVDNPMQYLLDAEGNVSVRQAPTARAVDMMKQAIDQNVASNTDPVTGRIIGPMGHAQEDLRRTFLTNADQASTVNGVSLYQQARGAYAGPAQLKDAARMGAEALSGNDLSSVKAQAFQDLSPAEQQAFRTGLAEAVIDKAGKMGPNTDPLQVFLKGRNATGLMQLYLGDPQAYRDFANTVQQQSRIIKADRMVMGGSPTARILAENQTGADDTLSTARDFWNLGTGGPSAKLGALANLVKQMAARGGNYGRGINENVANELGGLLFSPDAAANRATVQNIGTVTAPRVAAQTARQQLLQRRSGLLGPGVSSLLGGLIGAP